MDVLPWFNTLHLFVNMNKYNIVVIQLLQRMKATFAAEQLLGLLQKYPFAYTRSDALYVSFNYYVYPESCEIV